MLFFRVFASPHLRPFATSSFSAARRMGYSSHPISSIFRPHNSFRMNTYFVRFWRHLSPFRINTYGSVHSKQLYPPLESTLMKNGGRGVQLLLTRFPMTEICPEEHRNEGSLFNARKHFYPERPSGVKSVTSFQGTIGTTNAEGRALS